MTTPGMQSSMKMCHTVKRNKGILQDKRYSRWCTGHCVLTASLDMVHWTTIYLWQSRLVPTKSSEDDFIYHGTS
jgi:hypothetical protein